ncbi:transporter substrate-binding domain-containing protein, partial [Vibrio sp. 03_296]|uniref:transporter substrate-binding domain-containing protein n=1 Tax=Vibrio sp. 03_296 TaxID=2024409 RepID=UPI002D7E8A01
MKKWLLAATLAATAVSGIAQAKEWKRFGFGIEGAYPPFSWTEADGSLKGFDVDMANALCEEM